MNKPAILGAFLLSSIGIFVASCSGTKSNNAGAGGQASNGGATSTGGSRNDSGAPDAGSDAPAYCAEYTGGIKYDPDGGVERYGASDPADSVVLDVGGYYAMPGSTYHGYCFTFSDSTDGTVGGTSTVSPPCGTTGPCYTMASGLCSTAQIDQANGSISWGGGIGCNLHQAQGEGTRAGYTDIIGKTSVTVEVYGCKVPDMLQIQLNVSNPPTDNAGVLGDGYFCNRAKLPPPDANDKRKVTIPLNQFTQDCWNLPSPLPVLDPATHTVTVIEAQIVSDDLKPTSWDFCISKLSID